ncbi:MAG: nucleoside 2-deoxyribosyltransferase [Sphaerochaeta sp.]|nr:nucleoside 2-deoxyribosyltransferase [Sphaerochaeta sp.]
MIEYQGRVMTVEIGGVPHESEVKDMRVEPLRGFIICPVRKLTPETKAILSRQVEKLEKDGMIVHWPLRDTDQTETGMGICKQNREAIARADIIFVWQEGEGWLFDFGMAFALHKPIIVWHAQDETEEKSFTNVLRELGRVK